jgi:UDP-N-acetylglucosamine--N-acetylmuramyl-(pentapeptide) pyrophosphoryl-undecaprenol N-acetylglucosamine transferase
MKLLIGGGGTGGHIYPGLALARYALAFNNENEVLFVGSEAGLENKIVPSAGFKLVTIPARGFQRSFKNFSRVIGSLIGGIRVAGKVIDEFNPDVILGTGGYVAAPLMIAAVIKRKPTVVHEQNAIPGLANRLLAPFVSRVCISFVETGSKMTRFSRIIHTGNPRSTEVSRLSRNEGCRYLGLEPGRIIILIYGGSRGALVINQVVIEYLKNFKLPESVSLVFVTGEIYYRDVAAQLKPLPRQVALYPYLEQMPEALAAADLAVTRSGATTLAELTALGIPALLIPSPNVVNNHQYYNAKILADAEAAILIEEKDFNRERLAQEINRLVQEPEIRAKMKEKSRAIGVTDSAERIYRSLEEVAS